MASSRTEKNDSVQQKSAQNRYEILELTLKSNPERWLQFFSDQSQLFSPDPQKQIAALLHGFLEYLLKKQSLIEHLPAVLSLLVPGHSKLTKEVDQKLMLIAECILSIQCDHEADRKAVVRIVLNHFSELGSNAVFEFFCNQMKPDSAFIDAIFLSSITEMKFQVFEYFYIRRNKNTYYEPSRDLIESMIRFSFEQGDYIFVERIHRLIAKNEDKAPLLEVCLKSFLCGMVLDSCTDGVKSSHNLASKLPFSFHPDENRVSSEIRKLIEQMDSKYLYNLYKLILSFSKKRLLEHRANPLLTETRVSILRYFLINPENIQEFTGGNAACDFSKDLYLHIKIDGLVALFDAGILSRHAYILDLCVQHHSWDNDYVQLLIEMESLKLLSKPLYTWICSEFGRPHVYLYLITTLNNTGLLHALQPIQINSDMLDNLHHATRYLSGLQLPAEEFKIQLQALIAVLHDKELFIEFSSIADCSIRKILFQGEVFIPNIVNLIRTTYHTNTGDTLLHLMVDLKKNGLLELVSDSLKQGKYVNPFAVQKSLITYCNALLLLSRKGFLDDKVLAKVTASGIDHHLFPAIQILLSEPQLANMETILFIMDWNYSVEPDYILSTLCSINTETKTLVHINLLAHIIEKLLLAKINYSKSELAMILNINPDIAAASITKLAEDSALNIKTWNMLLYIMEQKKEAHMYPVSWIAAEYPDLMRLCSAKYLGNICSALWEIRSHTTFAISAMLAQQLEKADDHIEEVSQAIIYLGKQGWSDMPVQIIELLRTNVSKIDTVVTVMNMFVRAKMMNMDNLNNFKPIFENISLSVEKGKALTTLHKENLFDKYKNFILDLNAPECSPSSVAWALIQLKQGKILNAVYQQEKDTILLISQAKLKESPQLIKLMIFMLNQIVSLEQSKTHLSAHFMYQSKMDEKIQEYRLQLKQVLTCSSDRELLSLAHELTDNAKINQSCNIFGYSFFNSPDIESLSRFIQEHFEEACVFKK